MAGRRVAWIAPQMTYRLVSRLGWTIGLPLALAGCGGSVSTGNSPDGGAGGGNTPDGGASGNATPDGGTGGGSTMCTKSSVTFEMIAWREDGGMPADYCAGTGCGGTWLSIKNPKGEPIERGFACGVSCDGCMLQPCAPMACIMPHHLPYQGESETWDGTYFAQSTCGAGIQCEQQQCVAAGSHLVATMCAYPSTSPNAGFGCVGSAMPRCVDVPFDYPAAGPVVGIIYPTR